MIRRMLCTVSKRNRFPINVTNNAWSKIDYILKKNKDKVFVFQAIGGGCGGFNYNLKLIDSKDDNLKSKITPTVLYNNDSQLIIDPMSEMFLIGTTIDYVSEDYSKGIFENKFVFIPNKDLATTCGCGISFTPK